MARNRFLFLAFTMVLLLGACGQVPIAPTPGGGGTTPIPTPGGGGGTTPTPLPPQMGVLSGIVLQGPMCPVEREGQPCPDKPYAAELVVQDAAGKEVARLQAGTDGRFAVALAPGTYVLVPEPPYCPPVPRPPEPLTLSLTAGQTVAVTVTYDSGIR